MSIYLIAWNRLLFHTKSIQTVLNLRLSAIFPIIARSCPYAPECLLSDVSLILIKYYIVGFYASYIHDFLDNNEELSRKQVSGT